MESLCLGHRTFCYMEYCTLVNKGYILLIVPDPHFISLPQINPPWLAPHIYYIIIMFSTSYFLLSSHLVYNSHSPSYHVSSYHIVFSKSYKKKLRFNFTVP